MATPKRIRQLIKAEMPSQISLPGIEIGSPRQLISTSTINLMKEVEILSAVVKNAKRGGID